MHVFYTPDIGLRSELPEDESLHCVKVLRLPEGSTILLTDGKGSMYEARITRAHHKRCAVEIISETKNQQSRAFSVNIALAPTKNLDRMEWFAEKATEIGIDSVSLLRCRFSERKEVKTERIQKILVSAMKQSLKSTLPLLNQISDFEQFVKQSFDGKKYIAHCYAGQPRKALATESLKNENVLILIGPEGDFSDEEVAMAIQHGFVPISLGDSRLRTETAALVACHTIHVLNAL